MATLPRVPTVNATSYQLGSQLVAGATSLTLDTSVTGVVRAPGYLTIDRVDSSGNATATKREWIKFTGVSGTGISGLTRGTAGSTDQVHAVGAIVEFNTDVGYEQDWYDTFTQEHSTTGTHTSLASLGFLNSAIFNASGSTLQGLSATVPVWTYVGNISAATGIGTPLIMPRAGTINFITAALRVPATGASVQLDIFKNGVSILSSVYPAILAGATFISTASIATQAFSAGNVFTAANRTAASANGYDLVVEFHAR